MISFLNEQEKIAFLVKHKVHELCRKELENNGRKQGFVKIEKATFSLCDKEPQGQLSIEDNKDGTYAVEWEPNEIALSKVK